MKVTILALFLVSFILIDTAKAINYKEDYCNGRARVGNKKDGVYLECSENLIKFIYEKNFWTYQIIFVQNDEDIQDKCDTLLDVLNDNSIDKSDAVINSMSAFEEDEC